jgi:hypothetical protein
VQVFRRSGVQVLVLGIAAALVPPGAAQPPAAPTLKAVMLSPRQATVDRVADAQLEGYNTLVLMLEDGIPAADVAAAADRARRAGLDLYYWIEVARNPELARRRPEWMASLQGHPEWRRHFPKAPVPAQNEVVKTFPWVPVLYREAFDAHLRRIEALLKECPPPKGILLNDLQAAPSACGCGNVLCRWTPDYGPIKTATRLPDTAAADFTAAVGKLAPDSEILPVWTTECEEHDQSKAGACAGVACHPGACWYEYSAQLAPVAKRAGRIGALLLYRALGRAVPRYGREAAWVRSALSSFQEMPPKRKGEAVPAGRLIAVLQGWDVTRAQVRAQVRHAEEAGAAGYVVSLAKIDQGWEPRIVRVPAGSARPAPIPEAAAREPSPQPLPPRPSPSGSTGRP